MIIENGVALDPTSPLSSSGEEIDASEAAAIAADVTAAQADATQALADAAAAQADVDLITSHSSQIEIGQTAKTVTHAGKGGKPVVVTLKTVDDATLLYLRGYSWSSDDLTITGGPAAATGAVLFTYTIDGR